MSPPVLLWRAGRTHAARPGLPARGAAATHRQGVECVGGSLASRCRGKILLPRCRPGERGEGGSGQDEARFVLKNYLRPRKLFTALRHFWSSKTFSNSLFTGPSSAPSPPPSLLPYTPHNILFPSLPPSPSAASLPPTPPVPLRVWPAPQKEKQGVTVQRNL